MVLVFVLFCSCRAVRLRVRVDSVSLLGGRGGERRGGRTTSTTRSTLDLYDLVSRLHVAHQRGLLGRGVVALGALVRLHSGVGGPVVVEAGPLGEGLTAEVTLVGLLTWNNEN